MTVVANLVAKITADATGFQQGINKASGALNVFKSLLPAVTVGGVAAFVQSTIDAADGLRDMAIKTGTSTEFLSQMQHAANLTGVEFSTLTGSLTRMQNSLVNISRSGKATEQLAALGLNVSEILKLKPEEQFLAIGEALGKIQDPAIRTNAAIKIFGRSGAELGKLFAEGGAGIASMRAEADKLGLTIGSDTADAADRANDAITRLKGAFTGLGRTASLELAGPLADVIELLSRGLPIVGGFVSGAVTSIGQILGAAVASNVQLAQGNVSGALGILGDVPGDVAANFDGLLSETSGQTDVLKEIARNTRNGQAAVAQ